MQPRNRLMVNWSVQGPLLIRLIVHLVTFGSALASLVILCWMYQRGAIDSANGSNSGPLNLFWHRFLPVAGCSLALLPFVLYDLLAITNRIAGPLYRFEEMMKQFEQTGVLPQAQIRENDLLVEFCGRFHHFVSTMHQRYPDCQPASDETYAEVSVATETSKPEEPVLA